MSDAALNECYVREWLDGTAIGHVVDYDADTRTYSFPTHRAAVLTRAAGVDHLALVAQFIPLFSGFEQHLIGGFRVDGGLPYGESALPLVDGRDERYDF